MAQGRAFRIGFSLLASAMIGAAVALVSFSADAHARHLHRAHSMHFAPANVAAPEPAAEKIKDGKKPGRAQQGRDEGTSSGTDDSTGTKQTRLPNMKDLGPVDTSITIVRPPFQGAKADVTRQRTSKINPKTGKYFHTRQAFIRHTNKPVVRNTVGVSVGPHNVTAGQHGVFARVPAEDGRGAQSGVAGPGAGPAGVFHPSVRTSQGGALANHGALSGSSFPRRGFAPAGLGGQTKMTGTLSGSMIRPKY